MTNYIQSVNNKRTLNIKIIIILVVIYISLHIIDIITTIIGFTYGLTESSIIYQYNIPLSYIIKIFFITIPIILVFKIKDNYVNFFLVVFFIINIIIGIYAFFNNIYFIIFTTSNILPNSIISW